MVRKIAAGREFPMMARIFVVLVTLATLCQQSLAGAKKEWVKLEDCHYIDNPDNDGDSFHVRAGNKEFTARLYYVDAPETNLRLGDRTHDQALHFGITLDETMKAGEKAKQRTKELLQKPFVIWTRWSTAGGRGRESRYYVIVEGDGKDLSEILINEGLARTKGVSVESPSGEKAKAHMERLDTLEDAAREKHLGAWATSTVTQTASPTPAESPSQTPAR